jgi:L-seryl-tRNA(Ser) seleniumtransferase
VPVIVDAAAELPPPEHLRLFSVLGADLVVFSGGKGLRGPQASGIILGKRDLIEACRLNNNPHSSIGRPMKVGKEEICGLVRAVELYVARDHAADLRTWDGWTQVVLDAVQGLTGITAMRIMARTIPQAQIAVDAARAGISAAEIARQLRDGDPSIRLTQTGETLVINPHNLEATEEAELVAARLRATITAASAAASRAQAVPAGAR